MSAVSGTARPKAGTDPRPPGPPPGRGPAASPRPAEPVPPGAVPASRDPGGEPAPSQGRATGVPAEPTPSPAPASGSPASGSQPSGRPGREAAASLRPALRLRPTMAAACRVFAAQPVQIAHARRFIAGVLSGFAAAEDIVLCVCELASNAVLHSCSREPGGQFTVRVSVSAGGRIRAEVLDRGGPWKPEPAQDEEHGRGLLIVAALATRWGVTGSEDGRSAWLELDPPPGPAIS
jgi:serine/threonine-protein kinase RsbW